MKRLLQILTGFAFLLWPLAEALSLPPCPENPNQTYHNCFGSYTFDDGDKYVGEWKDNKFHGQGTYYYSNGDRYVGEWKSDKQHGQGIFYYSDGGTDKGEWKDDKLVDKELDLWDILWKILEYIVYAILVLFGLLLWWLWSGTNDSEEYEDD